MWTPDEQSGVLTLVMNTVYTYTASGKIKTSSTSYVMDGEEMPSSAIEYNYDGSGYLVTMENSMVDWFTTGTLKKTSRSTYQNNASGDVIVEINSSWNGISWVDEDKTKYEYNAAGDISVEIYSTWNGASWVESDKYENIYSTTNFSDVIFPAYFNLFGMNETTDFSYYKAITGINSFEMLNGIWKNTDKTTFYYSGGTSTNIVEFGNTLFTVYPNPASEQVNFSWKGNYESLSLELYQITGAKVLEQITYPGKPVSISKLENGVYFFKLLNGQQMVHTGKMIKR